MDDRFYLPALGLSVALSGGPMADPGPRPDESHLPTSELPKGEILRPWLDEVRAQRQAWEGRRRAADDRRRTDPWAAQRDAREQEALHRRDAIRHRIARDRELFRNYGPWLVPVPPGLTPPEPAVGQDDVESPDAGEARSLPGWDNGWYYHGY